MSEVQYRLPRSTSCPGVNWYRDFRVDANGKQADTAYTVEATDGIHSLIRMEPRTGRTHQLRVHMAYIGTPIRGDAVYGKESNRLYLHATSLEITIPKSNRMVFEAPLPEEFKKAIDQ